MKGICLTKTHPSMKETADSEYGWPYSCALKKFHAGRTILVKNRSVLSVESIEGIPAVIRRGRELGSKRFTVMIHTPEGEKPIPLDEEILSIMAECGAKLLAMESDYPIRDRENFLKEADRRKIAVLLFK